MILIDLLVFDCSYAHKGAVWCNDRVVSFVICTNHTLDIPWSAQAGVALQHNNPLGSSAK